MALVSACVAACADAARAEPDRAAEIVAKAIAAAGGWQRWLVVRDVSYVSSTVYFHPLAGERRESFGTYQILLHGPDRVRFSSSAGSASASATLAGEDLWLERDGVLVSDPPRLALARLHLAGNLFWISMPFALRETWLDVRDAGDVVDDGRLWHRLRVTLEPGSPPELGQYFVVFVDARSGRVERVWGVVDSPFLAHRFWLGRWLDYRDIDGLKVAHRREVLPADADGKAIDTPRVEQRLSDIRYDVGLNPAWFFKPIPQPRP